MKLRKLVVTTVSLLTLSLTTALRAGFDGFAGVLVESNFTVPNTAGSWDVWQIYVRVTNPNDQVHAITGNPADPVIISSSGGDFLDLTNFGASLTEPSATLIPVIPQLAYDSYVSIGNVQLDIGETVTSLTPGFPIVWGDTLTTDNGAWFRAPIDPLAGAQLDPLNNLGVFIGQFTVPAGSTLSGEVSVQGVFDGDGMILISRSFEFPEIIPVGACCSADDSCQVLAEADCGAKGGTYQGVDSTCDGDADNDSVPDACDDCDNSNNACADATAIGDGIFFGCTAEATNDGTGSCGNSGSSPDVWYFYTASCDGAAVAQTCGAGTSYDTVVNVFDGCGGSEIICSDDDCGATATTSRAVWSVSTGTEYLIRVTGYGGNSGDFELSVQCEPTPANDDCTNATNVGDGSYLGSLAAASIDGPGPCGITDSRDIWYAYTNTGDIDLLVTASLCNEVTDFDSVIAAYDACGGAEVACNDDDPDWCQLNEVASAMTWTVPCGVTHRIQVASYGDIPGEFRMDVSSVPDPAGADSDGDGVGDACDQCEGSDDNVDSDGDGVPDGCDLCPGFDDTLDADGDGIPNDCDACPDDPNPTITNIDTGVAYITLEDAIAASVAGETIELGAGTLCEWGMILRGKNITIRGQGRDQTIIDAGYNGRVFRMEVDDSTIEDLTIRRGVPVAANGGGAVQVMNGCNPTFRNCDFRECDGTGASNNTVDCSGNNSFMLFDSCRFLDNFGGGGASVYGGFSTARFVNCLFAGNSGAARTVRTETTMEVVNSTFADNTDGIAVNGVGASVTNCAFDASNTTGAIGDATASHSVFPGGTDDNIDGVPTFVDAPNGDYRLAGGSLGIDGADHDAYVAAGGGATDLNGDPRTHDDVGTPDTGSGTPSYLDMGAYEFQGTTVRGDCDLNGIVQLDDYSNVETCLLGPDSGTGAGCGCLDFDADGDVDLKDHAAFQLNFTGN